VGLDQSSGCGRGSSPVYDHLARVILVSPAVAPARQHCLLVAERKLPEEAPRCLVTLDNACEDVVEEAIALPPLVCFFDAKGFEEQRLADLFCGLLVRLDPVVDQRCTLGFACGQIASDLWDPCIDARLIYGDVKSRNETRSDKIGALAFHPRTQLSLHIF